MKIKADWQPTASAINQLPEPLRRYIHDLETRIAGMVRENWLLKQELKAKSENLEIRFDNPAIINPTVIIPTMYPDPYRLDGEKE